MMFMRACLTGKERAKMKLIVEIPQEMHEQIMDGYVPLGISKYLKNSTPLDDCHLVRLCICFVGVARLCAMGIR